MTTALTSAILSPSLLLLNVFSKAVNRSVLPFSSSFLVNNKPAVICRHQQQQQQQQRSHYTFSFQNNYIRYRRATRPRKSNNNSILLNYEQAQFAEKLGVTKSWNSWNTCWYFHLILVS